MSSIVPSPPQTATTTQRGLMSAADKAKLDGLGGAGHDPVTVSSPAGWLSLVAQALTFALVSASATVAGVVDTAAQSWAGVKTFTSALIASAGIQVAQLWNTNGTGASDVVLKVGTTQADVSVNDAATLWSLVTGLGTGSEVQRFSLTKTRAKVVVAAGSTSADPVLWFDTAVGARENIIQFGTSAWWEFSLGLFAGPYALMKARSGMYLSSPFLRPLSPNVTELGAVGNHFKNLFLGETVQIGIAGTARPTANATNRGTLWYSRSAGGAADTVEMCMKSAADTYSWVVIATA